MVSKNVLRFFFRKKLNTFGNFVHFDLVSNGIRSKWDQHIHDMVLKTWIFYERGSTGKHTRKHMINIVSEPEQDLLDKFSWNRYNKYKKKTLREGGWKNVFRMLTEGAQEKIQL